MKHLFKIVALTLLGLWVVSCEKDDNVTLDVTSNPSLSSDATTLVLTKDTEANKAVKFSWENPTFNTQVVVKDALEIAAAGSNFKNASSVNVTTLDKAVTYTVGAFNKIILDAGFLPGKANEIEVRMKSSVGSIVLYSNTVKMTVTPYLTEFPSFYIVGDASAVGWSAGSAQMLFKEENISTIYTYLENGKSFRFLGQQDWGPNNYSLDTPDTQASNRYFKTWSSNLIASPAENIQFTGTSGMYKITIDADLAKKTIEAVPSPINVWNPANLYLVGSVNGWNAGAAIPMTSLGNGKFEHTIALSGETQLKFLGQQAWAELEWGDIKADSNTGYLAPKGGNGNIKLTGTGVNYKITVDLKLGVYTIKPL